MNHSTIVKQFLRDRTTADGLAKGYPFVTISRQAGAGGHTLAREIIRHLDNTYSYDMAKDWELFDQKLCALLAGSEEVSTTFESLVAEEYQSEIKQFIGDMISGQPRQYKLYKKIFEVVRLLTTVGKVVVVGRAGAFVARDLPQGVHIRLVAGEKARIKRMAKLLEVDSEQAAKVMRTQDQSRERLVRDYFSADINDPIHYHAVFNTDKLAIKEIAEMVTGLVGAHMKSVRAK